MPNLYPLVRPVLRRLPAEAARELTLRALEAGLGRFMVDNAGEAPDPPILAQRLWGLDFSNPVGLAAGYDKDARVSEAMRRFGFGFVEIGTVTPRPQPGNSKPRVFRLEEDQAIVNRMGFNSSGLDAVIDRLSRRSPSGIVGVNLGKNRDTSDAVTDYAEGIRRAAGLADYLVVNISSPNTPGLRDLQRRASLESLLHPLLRAREESGCGVPLLVKIAPDLTLAERADIASVALDTGIDGPSTALLADMYRLTQGQLPLIGVGGVASASDAYAKIRAGACLVQLYTALVFSGPRLVSWIKKSLADLLRADGFASISEAVGSGHVSAAVARPTGSTERAA